MQNTYKSTCNTISKYHVHLSSIHFSIVPLPPPRVAPNNFRDVSVKYNAIIFSWNTLSYQDANGIVRWYIITCNGTDDHFVVSIPVCTYVYCALLGRIKVLLCTVFSIQYQLPT